MLTHPVPLAEYAGIGSHGWAIVFTDGETAFVLPSGRMFTVEQTDNPAELAKFMTSDGSSIGILYDKENRTYLGVAEFCRILTLALAEVATLGKFELFTTVLSQAGYLVPPDKLVDFIVEHQIHASQFHALLVDLNASSPLFSQRIPSIFPEVWHLEMAIGAKKWEITGLGKQLNGSLAGDWNLSGDPMCPFLVKLEADGKSFWLLDTLTEEIQHDWAAQLTKGPLPPAFSHPDFPLDWFSVNPPTHEEDAKGSTVFPVQTPLPSHPSSPQDFASEAFSLYQATQNQDKTSKASALDRISEMVNILKRPIPETESDRTYFAQILNLKGLIEKDLLEVEAALESLSWAFQVSPEGLGKQDIAYNYGYVQLMELSRREFSLNETDFFRIAHPTIPDHYTFSFPNPLWPGWDKKLQYVLQTFAYAADNKYKFSQVAMTHMVLGGTGIQLSIPARIEHLQQAILHYQKVIVLSTNALAKNEIQQWIDRCQYLIYLLEREPKRLWRKHTSKLTFTY